MTASRECFAQLDCGRELHYEWASLVPRLGSAVPCRVHGFCTVIDIGKGRDRAPQPARQDRAARRTSQELTRQLFGREFMTLGELRRSRFTLGLLCAAERSGLVEIDWHSERVRCCQDAGGDPA